MKISIIGPGLMSIPPKGWGAVETLIWDMYNALIALGHEVDIVNVNNPREIIRRVNEYKPDFVHIHYDDWVGLYNYIQYPCVCTSHFGYLEREEMFGGYVNIANAFAQIKPRIFCLSEGIKKVYIDYRKRQHLFQSIDSLYYAGNIADERFDKDKNYLGEWSKEFLYNNLTEYGNLVLLSDGEATSSGVHGSLCCWTRCSSY